MSDEPRPTEPVYDLAGLAVRLADGGLYLEEGGHGLLLDAPAGAASALAGWGALARLRGVALSSGRIRSVGGLVPLLCALEAHHEAEVPFSVWSPLGEERSALLADAWSRGWPDRFPLAVDTDAAGSVLQIGPFRVETIPVPCGEPRWRPARVEQVVGVGFRVTVSGRRVAFVPGAGPGAAVEHLCKGADLAVLEVGVTAWPHTERPWRMTLDDALRLASTARELWILGDDGRMLSAGEG